MLSGSASPLCAGCGGGARPEVAHLKQGEGAQRQASDHQSTHAPRENTQGPAPPLCNGDQEVGKNGGSCCLQLGGVVGLLRKQLQLFPGDLLSTRERAREGGRRGVARVRAGAKGERVGGRARARAREGQQDTRTSLSCICCHVIKNHPATPAPPAHPAATSGSISPASVPGLPPAQSLSHPPSAPSALAATACQPPEAVLRRGTRPPGWAQNGASGLLKHACSAALEDTDSARSRVGQGTGRRSALPPQSRWGPRRGCSASSAPQTQASGWCSRRCAASHVRAQCGRRESFKNLGNLSGRVSARVRGRGGLRGHEFAVMRGPPCPPRTGNPTCLSRHRQVGCAWPRNAARAHAPACTRRASGGPRRTACSRPAISTRGDGSSVCRVWAGGWSA